MGEGIIVPIMEVFVERRAFRFYLLVVYCQNALGVSEMISLRPTERHSALGAQEDLAFSADVPKNASLASWPSCVLAPARSFVTIIRSNGKHPMKLSFISPLLS